MLNFARFGFYKGLDNCNKSKGLDSLRHTTASHLLQSGVDINTIRAWLGHVSINTTNIYAEINMEMKVRALQSCSINSGEKSETKPEEPAGWSTDKDLMNFLDSL